MLGSPLERGAARLRRRAIPSASAGDGGPRASFSPSPAKTSPALQTDGGGYCSPPAAMCDFGPRRTCAAAETRWEEGFAITSSAAPVVRGEGAPKTRRRNRSRGYCRKQSRQLKKKRIGLNIGPPNWTGRRDERRRRVTPRSSRRRRKLTNQRREMSSGRIEWGTGKILFHSRSRSSQPAVHGPCSVPSACCERSVSVPRGPSALGISRAARPKMPPYRRRLPRSACLASQRRDSAPRVPTESHVTARAPRHIRAEAKDSSNQCVAGGPGSRRLCFAGISRWCEGQELESEGRGDEGRGGPTRQGSGAEVERAGMFLASSSVIRQSPAERPRSGAAANHGRRLGLSWSSVIRPTSSTPVQRDPAVF